MLLLEAQKYLEIVRKRGEAHSELRRVYYNIVTNKELFLQAYANLYANKGAMTPGVVKEDTVDGMSLKRIDAIMEKLKERTYTWTPVRRTYIEKKQSSKKRPLGMPGFTDKLLQEVIRMVLEAYYEPQFKNSSHGFRPNRGCHTALDTIATWKGTRWFIEGDIKGCFDNLDHRVIIKLLRRRIHDQSFLELLGKMLQAGYMDMWKYHKTYSGTPQGGIASPLFANIVLHELDMYIEEEIIPRYTHGKERSFNPEYTRLAYHARKARKVGNWNEAKRLRKQYTKLPSRWPYDPHFRRIWYVRYADDFLLGFIGSKREAGEIKEKIRFFLQSIQLEMSEEKTLVTHARTGKATFLGYHISLMNDKEKASVVKHHGKVGTHKRRAVNSQICFAIPKDVIYTWLSRVQKGKKTISRRELLERSDYDIIATYEIELQGLINYYNRAHNQKELHNLRYEWKRSLLRTLAHKYKMSLAHVRRKYERFYNEKGVRLIGVEIARKDKKPLRAVFGKKPIQRQTGTPIQDMIQYLYMNRNGLLDRLMAETCELCGQEHIPLVGHHIRKLKDLRHKWKGKEKPEWVTRMIAIRRKTLFVCEECHQKIHAGKYDGKKLT